jgi:hypothetical protein
LAKLVESVAGRRLLAANQTGIYWQLSTRRRVNDVTAASVLAAFLRLKTEVQSLRADPTLEGVTILLGDGRVRASYWTLILCGAEGMPFATTYNLLGPNSMSAGTSNFVDTSALPVATPMLLWSCVLQ